jgi:ABC-type transport system involved in multi-copper enzyme maturation permease subunit
MKAGRFGGVWLVLQQEFRIRLRTGRWRWLLAGWVLLLAAFTALLDLTVSTGYGFAADDSRRGVPLFGFLLLFVLALVLVISPALTSQTVNGDRERGTLATLQATLLRPVDIALGKLVAGWGVGLVALSLTLPFAGYAMSRGGITLGRMAAAYAVVAVLIGVVCAVSQTFSALVARSITSALLSYLTVFALTVGTAVALALVAPLVKDTVIQTEPGYGEVVYEVQRPDRVWWLIAPNPFVILADSAPQVPPRVVTTADDVVVEDYDPLSALARSVRSLRQPPGYWYSSYVEPGALPPVWPYGLAFNVLLGAAAVAVTTARLRTPTKRLPRATRIA